MKATILNVGTELLVGSTLNTHSYYLSQKLHEIGVGVLYHAVVGDNTTRLGEMIGYYYEASDLIIATGGLGPTEDDLTKEVFAEWFGVPLYFSEEIRADIEERFRGFGRPMTSNNLRQCYVPEGAEILWNENGTATGFILEKDGKIAVLLPGPPRELRPMFENQVMPWLRQRVSQVLTSRYFKIFGLGESSTEDKLSDLFSGQTNPTLATYAKTGEVLLRITASGASEAENLKLLEPVVEEIRRRIGDYIYAERDAELSEVLFDHLRDKGLKLALAESCTGGMMADMLVAHSGVSEVFGVSVVAYDNAIKTSVLGVPAETLETFGAVSEETAKAMSEGIAKISGAALSIAVTGIAGPEGGSPEKPVGLVYMDLYNANSGEHRTFKQIFTGNRERVRMGSAMKAFYEAIQWLKVETF
ncbi:competence/damage-inducible protein A [Acidaminobacter hydrogenoformans]|uniref:Putative competence-damage inducible protein n=1 Tax=Acidaminobacter hydrogenoformans DSM 2784 TaxID=1120920 RepID=A0A1G5RTQ1_9FIRM|nr:competence/damage-inducible protein A [Acidaminobacter hydrogenoformans]SCZ76821.1 nicotinamide-nucleotide amidase [Acidaminobacter hydrogenoformans DSM 2784]